MDLSKYCAAIPVVLTRGPLHPLCDAQVLSLFGSGIRCQTSEPKRGPPWYGMLRGYELVVSERGRAGQSREEGSRVREGRGEKGRGEDGRGEEGGGER